MDDSSFKKAWGKVIAKAWKDATFAKMLHEHPATAFKEMGLHLPDRAKVRVIDAAPGELVLVFPPCPTDEVEEQLRAGGLSEDPLMFLCACVKELCHSW